MSGDFSLTQPNAFDAYFPVDDSDEYKELEKTRQRAVIEAMQEVEAEFSSFEESCSEEEGGASDAEDTQENCDSETQQDSFQPVVNLSPSTHTSSPTNGSKDKTQSIPEGMMPHPGAHIHAAFPAVAWPGAGTPTVSTVPPSREAPSLPAAAPSRPVMSSASRDGRNVQHANRNTEVHDGGDSQLVQYKVHYKKPGLDTLEEEQFYLDNENVEFLHIDGPDNQRTYEQLEILYRARGREIEELTRKMEEKDEEKNKEIRNLKHRLAIANGDAEAVSETLRQGQQLLQQSKSDYSEACGKIRALETQVLSVRNAKEELIQKLQTAESTIENLTHHIEELQESQSLSRARNEHEAVVASLSSRHERELLLVREKLDVCKTSLETKQEELVCVKKQLADMARELDLMQVSKAETVNRLSRSLEESQRQCQAILEQSSSPEVSMMRVQLQQAVASKRISEDLCQTFQKEIKELKEQLSMFESASRLGVFTASSSSANIPSHDDSVADLGIRKTLNFDSPQARQDGTPALDKLIASLKSELERCLSSNRQQRAELADRVQQVKVFQEELQEARSRVASLEKTCADQKVRLQELDSLNKPGGGGIKAVEARLQREIEDLKRDMNALLADIEDYKTRLQEVGDSEAKLAEINAELNHQIAQMVNDFDLDKQSALQSCQRMMEAVNRQSFDKLRQDIEERFQSEKAMLMDDSKRKLDHLNQVLRSTQAELDNVKSLYVRICEEHTQQERELKESYRTQLEEELVKITNKLDNEKREWENFMRAKMEREQEDFKNSLRQAFEIKHRSQSNVSQDKLAGKEEQQLSKHTEMEEILADAKKQWENEHKGDIQQWVEERDVYESKLLSKNNELCECNKKLDLVVSEKERFQKLAENLEMNHQTNVKSLERKHREEMEDIVEKYKRQILQVEEKLVQMCQQFASCLANKLDSVTNIPESFQDSDILKMLHFLEDIINEKDARSLELEKMLQEQKATFLLGVSRNGSNLNNLNGSLVDLECYHGDLSEASVEKLKEHIKILESELHTMKQKHNREINELKQQHQKEFENASRLREDKFQAELRYFLKEKEDQYKMRMETAMKQCESQTKLQLDQAMKEADENLKCVIRETICEYENKKAELQKIIDEYEDRFNKEIKPSETKSADATFSLRDKMKREICVLEEKYITEKSSLERKLKQIEEEKDDEIVNLCLRQAEEERKLKEQFDNDLTSLKVEHQNIIRQLEQELSEQKSDAVKAQELIELLKKENESNELVVEELRKEVEQMKSHLSNTQSLAEQVKEERAKWFLEAQEYINKEIKQGVEDEIKKEGEKLRETLKMMKEEERKMREKWEKIHEEEGKVREKLEKIKEEEREMKEKWEEMKEGEEKLKRQQGNIEEWNKNKEKFEREKKEEMRKILQRELDKLNQKFVVEVNTRVEAMKAQVEQQKMAWQEEERQKLVGEREKIIQALRSHMERSLQEAKSQLEIKIGKLKENELREIRNEMQGEMRKRIQSVREEWEHEMEEDDNRNREELDRLKECLQAETDARIKACQDKDKALDQLKHREMEFQEEEQRLMCGLKQCQEDMEESSKRHEAVAEQVNNIDRKYKQNLKKLKAGKNQELAELKAKHAEEKDSLLTLLRAHYEGDLEKVRKQGEQERVALVVELERLSGFSPLAAKIPQPGPRNVPGLKSQDQHLDRTAPSPVDKLGHLYNAPTAMPAPVIGQEIIDIFKVKAKTYIRSALSQKVPESSITALEQSLDVLSEHMKSMTSGTPGPASSRPDSGKYSNLRQQLIDDDDDDVIRNKQRNCHTCSDAYIKNLAVCEQHLQQYHCSHHSQNNNKEMLGEQRSHPWLDKVDSDRQQVSSSALNNLLPAGQTYARSFVTPASRKENIIASYLPHLSPNVAAHTRTIPTKLEATGQNEKFLSFSSSRDERKFVEARVRLVNWAQTGEMPWKTSPEMSGTQLHDTGNFIKPGLDSEQWVGQHRDNPHFLTSSSKQVPRYYNQVRVPSDSDSEFGVSSDATTSFITLQTDATD